MPRPRRAHVLSLGLLAAGCNDACPEKRLPGLCSGHPSIYALGAEVDDAVLVDIDGDGDGELIGLRWGRPMIAWPDGRQMMQRLGEHFAAISAGDLDGDGRIDVALLTTYTARVELVAVGPEGALATIDEIELGGAPSGLRAADLDGDGVSELVTVDRRDGALVVVHGGDRKLSRFPAAASASAIELADLDGDGALDALVGDFLRGELVILAGVGDGRFAAPSARPSAFGISSIAAGDLDGDGDLDVVARGGLPELWIHPGDGAGGFGPTAVIEIVDGEGDARGLAIMPPGSDGVAGIMAPEMGGLSTWLLGQDLSNLGRARRSAGERIRASGPGTWLTLGRSVEAIESAEGALPVESWRRRLDDPHLERLGPAVVADLDGDGIVDIAALHARGEDDEDREWATEIEVFLGAGDGAFVAVDPRPMPAVTSLITGDFDGDGGLDLLGAASPQELWLTLASSPVTQRIGDLAESGRAWAPLGSLPGATRARLVVDAVASGPDDPVGLTLVTLADDGVLLEALPLAPDVDVRAIRIADLDGDDDDDLLLVGLAEDRRILRAWSVDGDALLSGPTHALAELTGWDEGVPLAGLGVDWAAADEAAEVIVASPLGLARIVDIDTDAPLLEIDAVALEVEFAGWIPPLIGGDLDGDGERDLLRCGGGCDLLRGEDGQIADEPVEVPLPAGVLPAIEIDGDDRIVFVVGDSGGLGAMRSETHAGPRAVRSWPGLASGGATPLAGDLDGDGRLEVVLPAIDGFAVYFASDTEDARTVALLDRPAPQAAAIADLDHDGRDEVVFGPASDEGAMLGALRWDGARLRVDPLEAPALGRGDAIDVLDLDGDGVLDLVVAEGRALRVAYGIDAAHFEAPVSVGPEASGTLMVGDLNGDGHPELLRSSIGTLRILWNRPGRGWESASLPALGAALRGDELLIRRSDTISRVPIAGETVGKPLLVAQDERLDDGWAMVSGGDLDGDGREDLITIHPRGGLVWLSDGESLEPAVEINLGLGPPVLADLDAGGRAEIVTVDTYGLWVHWGEAKR